MLARINSTQRSGNVEAVFFIPICEAATDPLEETTMAEIQSNQTEASAAGKGSAGRNGGTQRNQPVPQRTEQSRDVTSQESTGSERRALTKSGSRQLMSAAQNPFATMRQLSREMDRLMDSFFGRGFGSLLRDSSVGDDDWQAPNLWAPQIDVQHRNDAIVVRADLPGVDKDDVQIDVRDDALVISGQRREEREEGGDDQGYRVLERNYGSFYRTVPLPQGANQDEIEAVMRDGVLKVTVPLAENARPRRIQIQS
jgi:HSP20 family protein